MQHVEQIDEYKSRLACIEAATDLGYGEIVFENPETGFVALDNGVFDEFALACKVPTIEVTH